MPKLPLPVERFSGWAALLMLLWSIGGCRVPEAPSILTGQAVRARHGMVVSAHAEASRAGLDILQRGGNAVDAAAAVGFALAVVFPEAGNLGGGGFMVIRFPEGRTTTFDYREKAPLSATRDMFLDAEGAAVPERSRRGHLAVGTPGSVAGLVLAHERYGRLRLAEVLRPAIRLAERGYRLSRPQAARYNAYAAAFSGYPGSARYFTKPDGAPFAEGERFIQADLAAVLRRIGRYGRAGFYEGKTADLIVAEMQRGGGLITHRDLEAYEAVERPPLVGTYRRHRVITIGLPSSGGVALLQALNAVEPFDLAGMGFRSSASVHLMGEVMRRVYADRAHWLGDPDFVSVPVEGLLDKAYMRGRMTSFDPHRATPSGEVAHGLPPGAESPETTHYSVVDEDGLAVSTTTTINGLFGSLVAVEGAGFLLNNEMDDFSVKPGVPNMFGLTGSEANAVAGGKRMLSSMTPAILEDPEGRLFLVLGSPGGSKIITSVFGVITRIIDYDMNLPEAVAAPRIHHQWLPDYLEYEPYGLARDVIHNLEQRGWRVSGPTGPWGRVDAVMATYETDERQVDPSSLETIRVRGAGRTLIGVADPRGEDAALGY